jgi:hypothetical protein
VAGTLPGRGIRGMADVDGERGQRDGDKERSGHCASLHRKASRGLGREVKSGGRRSACREDAKGMPARCSMLGRLSKHGRERAAGRGQDQGGIMVYFGTRRRDCWRGGSSK